MINGIPKGPIKPSKGLRQDDPLSPYLFFLCTEGLMSLLKHVEQSKSLVEIRVCHTVPSINHLLFLDDSLIFYKANKSSSQKILDLLQRYA